MQKGKLWGYVDRNGHLVIPPKFEEAESFSEGVAVIGYYDKELEWVGATPRKGRWVRRFISRSGEWAVGGTFVGIDRGFDRGMAIVSRSLGYSEKSGGMISETYVIDKTGRELWKLGSPSVDRFSDDAIIVELERKPSGHSLYNYKDREGRLLCYSSFEDPSGFSEGLAAIRVNDKYGFINKQCDFVIEPTFAYADSFSDGLAAVKDASYLAGFIDKSGKWVIEPRFDWVDKFNEGFALFLDGSKSGYIDRSGNVIWHPSE